MGKDRTRSELEVPPHPVVNVEITATDVRVNGEKVGDRSADTDPYRVGILAVAERVARPLRRAVRVVAVDEAATTDLVVHPDGTASDVVPREGSGGLQVAPPDQVDLRTLEEMVRAPAAPEPAARPAPRGEHDGTAGDVGTGSKDQRRPDAAAPEKGGTMSQTTQGTGQHTPGSGERPKGGREASRDTGQDLVERRAARQGRESFIRAGRSVEPATQGWRGALNRSGFRLPPGPAETAYRDDVATVCRHWPGPKTIAVANPKGSAGKTPATVMLSAVFARYGGAGVLAWDNNETRGSLAWRTQQASHDATVLDLLPQVEPLLATGAQSAEMSHWTHHQPADRFDVLQSDQSVDGDHEVTGVDVEEVHKVARRYYRLVLMDSGNNERAANWRAMMRRANALVVPCTNVEDTAEAAALMLEALASRDQHSESLADNAVAIVSQRTPGKDRNLDRIVKGLRPLVREVVRIPYDPALVTGVISFDALRPETQRAWLRAAAAVARAL